MKLVYPLLLLLYLSAAGHTKAQELKRRADLGLRTVMLSDSLAKAHQLDFGVVVATVAPHATADAMGLRPGDILLALNKRRLYQPETVTDLGSALYPGQPVTIQLLRDGKKRTYSGKALVKAPLQIPTAAVAYGQVPFRGELLRTITYQPKTAGKHPAILFIPGFPCRSIEDYGSSSYGMLIAAWSKLGYTVMLVEKPGLGDNRNTQGCMQIDLYAEIEAFEQGLVALKEHPAVDRNNIFIFGHSMGGIIAPILTQKHAVKGVMVYGSPYRPWLEFALDMFRFQKPVTGTDYVTHEEDMRQMHHVLYRFFALGQHPDTIANADPSYRRILQEEFQYTGGDRFWSRHYRYWQEIDELNLTKAWAETEEKVLSIWGEYDFEIVNAEDHKRIAAIVNHYHPGNASFLMLPKTNHSFIKVPGMAEGVTQMQKRDLLYNQTNFSTQLVTATDAWMKAVIQGK